MRQDKNLIISSVERVKAIKANDDAILNALYVENYNKVENYVTHNNGTTEEAKDVYQEAFIAVWRNIQLDKFAPENETALAGYLFRVAKNKWLDHLRSSHYKKVISIENSTTEFYVETLPDDENQYITDVKKNFEALGGNCKEVLSKFYYLKQSLREIAETFNWTEATARNNKYRCLQRLRDLINNK